jgi:ATP-dependent DNA helicase RecQ
MATHRPGNLDELGEINGVGASKLERYGERMLQALRDAA